MLLALFAAHAAPPAWLEGCWTTAEAPVTREVWLTNGGLAVGVGTSGPAAKPQFEHLWLGVLSDTLTYVATPGGQTRTEFPATTVEAERLVFENPAHDFPQRITYEHADAQLTVRVEARKGDRWEGFTLKMARCAAP